MSEKTQKIFIFRQEDNYEIKEDTKPISLTNLEEEYTIREIQKKDLQEVRLLDNKLFPIRYNNEFYDNLLLENSVGFVAIKKETSKIVGVITGRLKLIDNGWFSQKTRQAYIMPKKYFESQKTTKIIVRKRNQGIKKDIRITKTNLKYGTRELRLLWRELEIEKKEAEYAKKVITKNSNYQTEGNEQNNIDLVYTWGGLTKSIDASDRYNYELQYSIRSVYKHLPWINKIYVLVHSEADYPYWLKQADEQDKVIVVDVCDYFTNHKHCPTSNSFTVFSVMHGIKGLANKFILMDDNVFFNQPLKKEYFFTKDHLLRVFERHNRMNIYQNRNFKDIHYPEYKYAAYSYLPKPMRRDFINKFHEYYQGYTEFVQSHNSRYRGIIEDFAMVYYEYFYEKDWLKSENYKRIGFYQIPMEHEDNIIEEFNKIYNDLKSKEVKVFNCNDDFSTESEIYKKQLKVLFSFYNKLYPEVPFFEVENPNHHKYF